MNVLIVESPSKAKSINKYLGSSFKVLASIGHIRDLSPKNDAIDTNNNFQMKWEISDRGKKVIKDITDAAQNSENLYLATDPDREGEAIGWHIAKFLDLDEGESNRIVFNEITKNAIQTAIKNPRDIDINLVNAQQARRVLDRIVGFKLSPILWKKVKTGLSAGRVQSVALRFIAEREQEIEVFIPKEYWTISLNFMNNESKEIPSKLILLDENKVEKFSFLNKENIDQALKKINSNSAKNMRTSI